MSAKSRKKLEWTLASGVNGLMGPERLGFLIDRHAAALELAARQWCACPEDVVQETFLKLSRQGREPEQIAAWLYRVARNAAISAGRSQLRRQRHEAAAGRVPWFTEEGGGRLDAAALTEALAALPDESREVIVAHLWNGLTFEQLAEALGISTTTAHRRYVNGLNELRTRLKLPCPNP
jgi:RNA polymerase sigma factor (sigma-70 family)